VRKIQFSAVTATYEDPSLADGRHAI